MIPPKMNSNSFFVLANDKGNDKMQTMLNSNRVSIIEKIVERGRTKVRIYVVGIEYPTTMYFNHEEEANDFIQEIANKGGRSL